jgi:hypothetical protein
MEGRSDQAILGYRHNLVTVPGYGLSAWPDLFDAWCTNECDVRVLVTGRFASSGSTTFKPGGVSGTHGITSTRSTNARIPNSRRSIGERHPHRSLKGIELVAVGIAGDNHIQPAHPVKAGERAGRYHLVGKQNQTRARAKHRQRTGVNTLSYKRQQTHGRSQPGDGGGLATRYYQPR